MKQIRKTNGILRNSLFFGLVLFMLFLMPYTVKAENVQGFVFFRFEEDGETYVDLAVCADTGSGEISFLTYATGEEDNYGSPRIDVSDNSFSLEYRGAYDNLVSVWGCPESDILQYVDQYKLAYPVKGEKVTAVYLTKSGENYNITREQTCVQSSTEIENGSGRALIFDEVGCEYMPGVLENAEGECVGIILKNTVGYPLQYDDSVFDSESAAEIPTEQPSQNESPKETGEQQSENQAKQDSEQKTSQIWILAAAVVGLVALILIVLLIKGRKKSQKPERISSPELQSVPPIPSDSGPKTEWFAPTPPDSKPKPERIAPTAPLASTTPTVPLAPTDSKRKPAPKQFFLYIKSGYMMGQAYPVGADRILIGRDGKCRIQYPKNYTGISNIHASVFQLNGKIYLKDENSSYGTYLKTDTGMKRIEPSQQQELCEGSEFYLAEKKNMIHLVSAAMK